MSRKLAQGPSALEREMREHASVPNAARALFKTDKLKLSRIGRVANWRVLFTHVGASTEVLGWRERQAQGEGESENENRDDGLAAAVVGRERNACVGKLLFQFVLGHDAECRFGAQSDPGPAACHRRFTLGPGAARQ